MKDFTRRTNGNIVVSTGLLAPLLLGAAGYTADYAIIVHERSKLQDAADAAALTSVRELGLAGAREEIIQSVAASYVNGLFVMDEGISNGTRSLATDTEVSFDENTVKVDLAYTWKPFLAHLFDTTALPIRVTATATLAGEALTCIVGLMQPQTFAKASIHLDNKSSVRADNCAVYSNSVSRYGLRADARAEMIAGSICSAGGVMKNGFFARAKFTPEPITDCPKIEDPLLLRRPPTYGGCNHDAMIVEEDITLSAGVYCKGLTISKDADVKLSPGIYVIKDGPLIVQDDASIAGKGVTFYLTGEDSIFNFAENTKIDIEAMEDGTTAGILFFEDRDVPHSFDFNPFTPPDRMPERVRMHRISSNFARNLLGTMYLSKSILLVDAEAAVADVSAYTAIITGRLWLQGGPTLHLNADLTDTKVPAPEGLVGSEPQLIR